MSLRLTILPVLAMLLLIGALAAACSSDDDGDTGDTDPTATATESADDGDGDGGDGGSGGGGGSGSATLTVDEESWSFEGIFCAFSPEEAGNDRVSFTMSATGETAEGVRTQLDATIQDPDEQGRYEGEGVIHSVSLNDVEDFENPAVAWSALTGLFGEGEWTIQVDGKSVTAEATFDDERTDDQIEEVAGSLVGTCP